MLLRATNTPVIVQVEDDDFVKAYWKEMPGDRKYETEAENVKKFLKSILPLAHSDDESNPAVNSSASAIHREKEHVESEKGSRVKRERSENEEIANDSKKRDVKGSRGSKEGGKERRKGGSKGGGRGGRGGSRGRRRGGA